MIPAPNYRSYSHLRRFDVRRIRSGGFNSGKLSFEYKRSRVFFVGAALRGRPCVELNYRRMNRRLSRGKEPISKSKNLRQGAATEGRPYSTFFIDRYRGGIACLANESWRESDNTGLARHLDLQRLQLRPKRVRRSR